MKIIKSTTNAPAAIGPYNQSVVSGDFVYTCGCISLNPEGELVGKDDIKAQTTQVFKNLQAILENAGANFDKVVKTTCFVKSMDDFKAFNEVYATYFDADNAPARSTVEVSRLPMDVLVEVEAIAYLG